MKDQKNKKQKDPVITTRKRADNSIEVVVKKSPSKTTLGKITIILILIGMAGLSIVSLIYILLQAF